MSEPRVEPGLWILKSMNGSLFVSRCFRKRSNARAPDAFGWENTKSGSYFGRPTGRLMVRFEREEDLLRAALKGDSITPRPGETCKDCKRLVQAEPPPSVEMILCSIEAAQGWCFKETPCEYFRRKEVSEE